MRPAARPSRTRRSPDGDRRRRTERGFVLVWFALVMIIMLSVAAFAVDLGHAYLVGQQAQDAADAAALSAASYLPDNCKNADQHALAISSLNGFTDGVADTNVTAVNGSAGGGGCDASSSLLPTQIKVDVKTKVDTWFARAIGISTLTVSRSSTAEYDPPVALGSPNSNFGTAPGCTSCFDPHVWANMAGQDNRKVDGNAIFENWCDNTSADNCSGNSLNNADHDNTGMLFEISNPTLENLNIEMFDPGYVDDGQPSGANGNKCNDGTVYPICTGDTKLSVLNGNDPPVSTRFTLYPLDNLSNPLGSAPLCHVTYPGHTSPADALAANDATTRSFHTWANLSTDASGCGTLNASSYVLQVQSGDDLGGTKQTGSNMFSIAACSSCGANQPQNDPNVAVSAITKMSLFTNATGTNPQFYLARVPSWARGQVLTLSFFDIGDVSNSNGSPIGGALSVVAVDAVHSSTGGAVGEFSSCTYSHPATRGYVSGQITPWGSNPPDNEWAQNPNSLTSLGGGCTAQVTVNASASDWNGKWVTFKVPIPSDYSCTDNDFTKCWLQVKYNYPIGAVLHDATTWTASLSGNPVRLTK